MARFLPDTSCVVAAVLRWHEHHAAALDEMRSRLERGEGMVLAAPSMVEAYSVLTQLPRSWRIAPHEALALLENGFLDRAEIAALGSNAYLEMLRRAPAEAIAGGRVYDAVIAACAVSAGVDTLLTFNERHFLSFGTPRLAVVVPGRTGA